MAKMQIARGSTIVFDTAVDTAPPFWLLTLFAPATGGERLVALERRIVAELDIKLDPFMERFAGPKTSPFYASEDDCCRVAVEVMRRKPALRVFVTPSDPSLGETYSPIANTDMTRLVITNPFR